MIQEKLQQIIDKCIEANPAILDLKFGCEVWCSYWSYEATKETIVGIHENGTDDKGYYCALRKDYTHAKYFIEIIGRTITLSDIILTYLRQSEAPLKAIQDVGNDTSLLQSDVLNIVAFWNKKEDDLEKQSEETKELIYNLFSAYLQI